MSVRTRERRRLETSPEPGRVAEKVWVRIEGVDQGMFIQTRDRSDPVLLVVHGGPGLPDYLLTARYPTGLDELFPVVWWEQRGTGLSYRRSIPRRP